jgi:2-polyprenyl-6-hydroxyphenyl methylase/3-demethylubiquinone-9 3-methyltransferase
MSAGAVLQAPVREVNDPRQYDDLAALWWDPAGRFAMLQWLAASRARHLPPCPEGGRVLVDIACGGGLLAPHVEPLGYRHIGVDIGEQATRMVGEHGVTAVRADVLSLPLADAVATVVVAGEVLEHVHDVPRLVAEICRILRPGGTVVLDTLSSSRIGRFVGITVAERRPGGPPPGIHDPDLFVNPRALRAEFAKHGVTLATSGLFPHPLDYLRWLVHRRRTVRMLRVPCTAIIFDGVGVKRC